MIQNLSKIYIGRKNEQTRIDIHVGIEYSKDDLS